MIFIVLFVIIILSGLVAFSSMKNSAGVWETLSISFLIGIFFTTLAIFFLDIINLKIGLLSIIFFLLLISAFLLVLRIQTIKNNFKRLFEKLKTTEITKEFRSNGLLYNTLVVVLFLILVFSFSRTIYWPTTAYDNVTGYDLMAKVLAEEGTLTNSLFDENGTPIEGSAKRLVYPPMSPGSFSIAYISGFNTSKIIPAFYNIFFVILFYFLVRRFIPKTTSIFLTILMYITPDFISFSFLSSSNIIFAIFISSAIIYLFSWYKFQETWMLVLSSLFLASATWTRSEAIIIVAAIFIVMIIGFDTKQNYKKLLLFILPSIVLFITWNIFVEFNYNVDQNVFHKTIFISFEKLKELVALVTFLLTRTRTFGIAFYLLAIIFIVSIPYLKKDKSFRTLTYLLLIPILAYTFIYYQMDNSEMDNLYKMITASYKRGMLAFIPAVFFYIVYSPIVTKLSCKLEEKLSPSINEN